MRPSHAPSRSRSLSNWILLFLLLLSATGSAQTPWVQSHRLGNEVRFLYSNLIRRYDLTTRSWLPDVTLPRTGATAFTGDASGNVVAYGWMLYNYSPSWSGESSAGTLASTADRVFVDGNLIIATHSVGPSGRVTTLNRSTATIIEYKRVEGEPIYGASLAPRINRLFGRTSGVATPDLATAGYSDSGTISGPTNSPYSGTYPTATRAFVFPDDRRVVDSSGSVYSTGSMTYLGSLGPLVTDIAWNGDTPIVLAGNALVAFNPTLEESGRITLATSGVSLAVTSSDAFIFRPAPSTPSVEIITLDSFGAPPPSDGSLDLAGTRFPVTDAFVDTRNIIHLVSGPNSTIARFSPDSRTFLPPLMLPQEPAAVSYSQQLDRLYFVTHSEPTAIRSIDFLNPIPIDVPFASLPGPAQGIAAADDLLHSSTTTGNLLVHSSFGAVLNNTTVSHTGSSRRWDPVRRRMYRFRENTTPRDLLYEVIGTDGRVGQIIESPYNGEYSFVPPILVSPDGNRIVIGSGVVFNATGLTRITTLPITPTDGIWLGTTFLSIRPNGTSTTLQSWDSSYSWDTIRSQIPGTPIRIFSIPSGYAVITSINGSPQFNILNSSFNVIYQSPLKPLPPSAPSVRTRSSSSVSLTWSDQSDNEDSFRIEFRLANSNSPWSQGLELPAGSTSGSQPDLLPDRTYQFRIRAVARSLASSPSPIVTARTLSSPDEPLGEPYQLSATRIFATSISLSWSDNATNESGFRILRSLSPDGPVTSFSVPANVTSFTDSTLAPGTTFHYRVQSFNGPTNGELSSPLAVATRPTDVPPPAPGTPVLSEITPTSVRLTWTDNSLNEESFEIERSSNPVTSWSTVATPPFNTSSIAITGLTPLTSYSFRVRATNSSGSSSSAIVTFNTPRVGGEFLNLSRRHGNICYFVLSGPHRIERYDLAANSWLTPLPLNAQATALWIDSSGIYAAEGNDITRWNLDGSSKSLVATMSAAVRALYATNTHLVASTATTSWTPIPIATGVPSSPFSLRFIPATPFAEVSFDPLLQRAFFSSRLNSNSSGICLHALHQGSGFLSIDNISAFSQPLPAASRTFLFPNGGRIADDGGSIYSTDSLLYMGSLGSPFTDLAFVGSDIPIVLRNNELHAYNNTLTQTASLTLVSTDSVRLAVHGTNALVFARNSLATSGLSIESIPLASLGSPVPDQPIDASTLAYTPDEILSANDDVVCLLSRKHLSIFRWSRSLRSYLPSIPLLGVPDRIAISPDSQRLYTAYASGFIRQIDLSATSPAEQAFTTIQPAPRLALVALFASPDSLYVSGERQSDRWHSVFGLTGTTLSTFTTTVTERDHSWDPVLRRIYYRIASITPTLAYRSINPNGSLLAGPTREFSTLLSFSTPIRIRPDGQRIAFASGQILSQSNLALTNTLPVGMSDLLWIGDDIASIRPSGGNTLLQRWLGPLLDNNPLSLRFSGSPLRILNAGSGYLVITQLHGRPRFTLTDAAFIPSFYSDPTPQAPSSLTSLARNTTSITLSWSHLADNASSTFVESRIAGSNDPWLQHPAIPATTTQLTISDLSPGTRYEFRASSLAGTIPSAPSPSFSTSTLTSPNQPVGEPYNFTVRRFPGTSNTFSWQDNASNETAFAILRYNSIDGIPNIIAVPPNTTSYTEAPGAGFSFYRIQAINGATPGGLSAAIPAPTIPTAGPFPPTDLSAIATQHRITLSWRDNSTNEAAFILETYSALQGTWSPLQTLDPNVTSTVIENPSPGVALTLRIAAVNSYFPTFSDSIVVTPQGIGGSFLNLSTESSGIQYFAFASPDRIERYHLSSRQWLPPLPMSRPANALWIDDSAIYAAEDRSLIRWNLDGSNRQTLITTPNWISAVFTTASILGIHDGLLRTFDRETALPLKSLPTPSRFVGPSVSPTTGRVFYRNSPGFPNATGFIDLATDGSVALSGISSTSPGIQESPLTRVFPDGSRIIEESGRTLTSSSLYQLPSIGTFDDVAFAYPDTPITLSSNNIRSYRFGSVGTAPVSVGPQPAKRISVNGTDVIVFRPSPTAPNGMVASAIPLSTLNIPTQDHYNDPSTLPYTPSDAFIDRNGDVRILSRDHLGLFRWSPSERKYTAGLYLRSSPAFIAHHPPSDSLYLADQNSTVSQLDLSEPAALPVPFKSLDLPIRNISLTNNSLFASHGPAATPLHSVFSLTGDPLSSTTGIASASAFAWDPANRQLYSLRSQSPASLFSDSISTDGIIGSRRESTTTDLLNPSGPIRVSNNGNLIALASGTLFRSIDLTAIRDIGIRPADMLWIGNQLVSLEPTASGATIVQRWSSTWTREKAAALPGLPIRILQAHDGNLIVITKPTSAPPSFHTFSPDLNLIHSSAPTSLIFVRTPLSQRIPFLGETVFEVLAYGPPPLSYQWFRNNQAIPGATSNKLPIVRAGSSSAGTYWVRVSSSNSTFDSNSFTLSVGPPTTSPPPFSPRSLLVSGDGSLRIFAPPLTSTTPQRTYTVPLPPDTTPSNSIARTSGAAVDRIGRLHTLNHAFGADSSQVFLSTHDPSIGSWSHRPLPGIRTSSSWREGDLCLSGDWAVMNRGRFHLFSSEWRPFPPEWLPSRIATTPAGNIFGINTTNIVRQFLPASDSWDSPVPLQLATPADAFAVASNGTFFVVAQGTYHSFNPDGSPLRSVRPPATLNPINLSIGGTDNLQLAAGPAFSDGPITITQTSLATESRFTPTTSSTVPGMFVSWVPVMDLALPAFIQSPPPPATEDVPWSWKPEATHPDPDATIVITALSIPPWMSFSNGTLSGTPTDPISPTSTISLRARDNLNRESLWSPTLAVTDINDSPVIPAAIPNISASNTAADQLITFAPFASDPDVGEVLTWRITANSNPALFSSLSFDAQGRLAIRYAPYLSGTATITVSVTDRFGASAQRSFNITVPPLPAPTITSQTPPSFNPLTGLWELPVTIRNVAQRAIGGFSLATSSLPQGTSLYNASNALSPSPAITDARPLNPNQSVSLTLEFLHPSQDPLPAPTLTTATALPRPAPPTPFAIDRASFLSPESLLLEFPSEPGTLYQIQYSADGTNWLDSLARIRAAGTSTQWIDSGSPRTSSPPGSGSRFYRIKHLSAS